MSSYESYINAIPKQEEEVKNDSGGYIGLGAKYSDLYRLYPKAIISSYLKFVQIKSCFQIVVSTYKAKGIFIECRYTGKDFTQYCSRFQTLTDQERQILADMLLIIYALNNPQ